MSSLPFIRRALHASWFVIAIVALWLSSSGQANAFPGLLRQVEQEYNIVGQPNSSCDLCHSSGGGSPRNSYGIAFQLAGANVGAMLEIEGEDSDGDGASNLAELLAGTFPGDGTDTPSEEEAKAAIARRNAGDQADSSDDADALPEVDTEAGEFVVKIPPEGLGGRSARGGGGGPPLDVTFGGAIDMRVAMPTNKRGQDRRTISPFVHVAEVNIQTQIGERITLLGEILLPMNQNIPLVAQFLANDHGFFYATIRDIPFKTASLWVGRFRLPYGVDAVLDGPNNPLPTAVYRSIARISDLALMVKGYAGILEYSFAVTDGIGVLPAPSTEPDPGESLDDWPLFGRLGFDLSGWLPGLNTALSGYMGRSPRDPVVGYPPRRRSPRDPSLGFPSYPLPGDMVVRKLRGAYSLWYSVRRFGVFAEVEGGQDVPEDSALPGLIESGAALRSLTAYETFSAYARVRGKLTDNVGYWGQLPVQ